MKNNTTMRFGLVIFTFILISFLSIYFCKTQHKQFKKHQEYESIKSGIYKFTFINNKENLTGKLVVYFMLSYNEKLAVGDLFIGNNSRGLPEIIMLNDTKPMQIDTCVHFFNDNGIDGTLSSCEKLNLKPQKEVLIVGGVDNSGVYRINQQLNVSDAVRLSGNIEFCFFKKSTLIRKGVPFWFHKTNRYSSKSKVEFGDVIYIATRSAFHYELFRNTGSAQRGGTKKDRAYK